MEDPSEAVDPAPRRAAPTKQESLLRALFGLPKPNEETRIVHNDSFKDLHFIGGEEEAHDYWDRKWGRRTGAPRSTSASANATRARWLAPPGARR